MSSGRQRRENGKLRWVLRDSYTESILTNLNRPTWVSVEIRNEWNGEECLFLLYLPHDSAVPKSDSVL